MLKKIYINVAVARKYKECQRRVTDDRYKERTRA